MLYSSTDHYFRRKKTVRWQKSSTGLPDFSWYNTPKREKIYQITIKYTNRPENIPTASIARAQFAQIRIFGFKICHLATLVLNR
jgi:hypothetical protein